MNDVHVSFLYDDQGLRTFQNGLQLQIFINSVFSEEKYRVFDDTNSYEIYSFALTQQLFNALGWTDRTTCYRLRGEVNQAKKIALFAFDNVEKVELEA